MEPKDIKGSREPIYEPYDIPIVVGNGEDGYSIDWGGLEGGLSSRLAKGLKLSEEQYRQCRFSIEEIKQKYFPEGYDGYDEWGQNEDGTYYLKSLMPSPGLGVWMYVYAHKGMPRHLDARMRRLDVHNVRHLSDALFFQECLVEYLKHAGINVPGIRSEVVKTSETKMEFGDRERVFKTNVLSYSFELPYLETSESLLPIGLKNYHNIDAEVQGNQVFINGKVMLEKKQKNDGSSVWIGKNLKDSEATKLFSTIARCNWVLSGDNEN
jgi:hypothetical protein